MSNYSVLKSQIDANIKRNGRKEISGTLLNAILKSMISALGEGYQYAGVATPSTDPGTPDARVFYYAKGVGTYSHFGGIEVSKADDIVLLVWDTTWKKVLTGIASGDKLNAVTEEVGSDTYVKSDKVRINLSTEMFDFDMLDTALVQIAEHIEIYERELNDKLKYIYKEKFERTLADGKVVGVYLDDDGLRLRVKKGVFESVIYINKNDGGIVVTPADGSNFSINGDVRVEGDSTFAGEVNMSYLYLSGLQQDVKTILTTLQERLEHLGTFTAIIMETPYDEVKENYEKGLSLLAKWEDDEDVYQFIGYFGGVFNFLQYDGLNNKVHLVTLDESNGWDDREPMPFFDKALKDKYDGKMTWCGLESDGNTITLEGKTTPLTYVQIKEMVDDPSLFVALRYGLFFWLLPQYDDEGGAIIFTGVSTLSATGELWRIGINQENQVSQYSIWLENAYLKTDDLTKEKIDNFFTYPTTKAVNEKLTELDAKLGWSLSDEWIQDRYVNSSKTLSVSISWESMDIDVSNLSKIYINAMSNGNVVYGYLLDESGSVLITWNNEEINQIVDLSDYPSAKRLLISNRKTYTSRKVLFLFKDIIDKIADVDDIQDIKNKVEGLDGTINGVNPGWNVGVIDNYGDISPGTQSNFYSALIKNVDVNGMTLQTTSGYQWNIAFYNPTTGSFVSRYGWQRSEAGVVTITTNYDARIMIATTAGGTSESLESMLSHYSFSVFGKGLVSRVEVLENNSPLSRIEYLKRIMISDFGDKILHFSFDDTCWCLNALIQNELIYSSIFDNTFFKMLKDVHDETGMVFTLNTFNTITENTSGYYPEGFNISDVPTKFQSEFQSCKSWLKFAFHAYDEIANYNTSTGILEAYNTFVSAIYKLTGDYECIDRFTRLGFFGGNLENCLAIKNANHGIQGLLGADDQRSYDYYLSPEEYGLLRAKGKYVDDLHQLMFIKTQNRIMSTAKADVESNLCYQKVTEFFEHEYGIYRGGVDSTSVYKNTLIGLATWANGLGYKFAFPSIIFAI